MRISPLMIVHNKISIPKELAQSIFSTKYGFILSNQVQRRLLSRIEEVFYGK